MRIEVSAEELTSQGLEIGVKGFQHDAGANESFPTQVFIEFYEGQLKVHVWDGGEDAAYSVVIPGNVLRS